ncbi:DsbA family protein [Paenochrobactrum glaciei]|uniref:DsbA family protein n=1 Tax=Paenochrobactrum glaciei TaxID=486407 RepID=A0ABN1FH14_9HYPH
MTRAFTTMLASALIGTTALFGGGFAQLQAQAQTASAPVDQAAVEKIVRDYLLKNPEILAEMQTALETKQAAEQEVRVKQVIANNQDELLNSSHDAVLGNPKGDVTVVEFFDYNCGYCKRAMPDMEAIIKSDPNVRFVMKEFPILGPDSIKAHMAAQAFKLMMPEKYRDLHMALMTTPDRSTDESVIAEAVKLGADEAALREKINSPEVTSSFQNAYKLANELDINGTPSYVIGNELIPGAIGADGLKEKIAEARAQKK